ncbi:phospholipid phosphatase-related protein type 5-like isoform X1 [Pungitius pungitius]|uniref:phospholipid phosphatase-related protein type 5-like isoform X1 n=1 Tax=Pungitius pungitius TaxID=134920 RepID=UPI002E12727F
MLYFQVVILAFAVMLVYYCEFTDTFSPAHQGFACRDPTLSKPDPGPEQGSRVQPVILYSVVGGLPVVLISGVELVIFLLHYNSNNLYDQEKVVVMGDCCYVNPMLCMSSVCSQQTSLSTHVSWSQDAWPLTSCLSAGLITLPSVAWTHSTLSANQMLALVTLMTSQEPGRPFHPKRLR